MHIPDNMLDAKTAIGTGALAVAGLGYALRRCRIELPQKRVPLLGLTAAFVFAAQMINFPIPGGTSGHLIGSTLVAILLGPSAAVVVLACVLLIQCFMFGDGGVTALGANTFNMGIVAMLAGYTVYRLLVGRNEAMSRRIMAAVVAGWAATIAAAFFCAAELAISGTAPWRTLLHAMMWWHMFIGMGEGIITALVISALAGARPELLSVRPASGGGYRELMMYGLLISLAIGMIASPWASGNPDGLDRTAKDLKFTQEDAEPVVPAPVPDYKIPGIGSEAVATAIAGGVGTLAVFGLGLLMARILVKPRRLASA